MNKTHKRQLGVVLGLAMISTLVGSTAFASIPASDGTITGCYRPTGIAQGELVVIDDTESCPTGYTALNWNQQGPAGVSGYEIVTDSGLPGTGFTHTTNCPVGKKVISGGVKWNGLTIVPISQFSMVGSYPAANGTGWTVDYASDNSTTTIDAYAVCVNA